MFKIIINELFGNLSAVFCCIFFLFKYCKNTLLIFASPVEMCLQKQKQIIVMNQNDNDDCIENHHHDHKRNNHY